jgi:hypothetical protein
MITYHTFLVCLIHLFRNYQNSQTLEIEEFGFFS